MLPRLQPPKIQKNGENTEFNQNITTKGKYIDLDTKGRKYLRETFDVSAGTVSDALNFKINTDLSRKLCYVALTQLGGELKMELPIAETIHDHAGFMTQQFENGAVLTMNKKNGYTTIVNRYGDLVKETAVQKISELESCQELAARL